MTTLYSYYRSSAAYRVRIALHLKGVAHEQVAVNLARGEQHNDAYRAHNPQGLVPMLVTDNGRQLTQSLAICEYLEERYPTPALLPDDAESRARVRALCQAIASDIHPLNNLRVLQYLVKDLEAGDDAKLAWYQHWVHRGFAALETMLTREAGSGDFCHGDTPSLADVCLVPQVFNAERFACDLSAYPRIMRIADNARALDAFQRAAPGEQPDAV
ncbi:maleylacetoacetate isomerase [Halomonas sabkhae]|uniref:maleylacetoacetate isomerase n=1 Tax=Halomonas sabkhae TaxID=626223 RepID=UPI0025B477AA|nr:maleylacetoacetate isomerase [Halomonas sabkhae]MDN3525062.1 maleylacetoacetate isomerase [Halomonas sabkhae]